MDVEAGSLIPSFFFTPWKKDKSVIKSFNNRTGDLLTNLVSRLAATPNRSPRYNVNAN